MSRFVYFLALLLVAPCCAQRLGFGVKGGVRVSEDLDQDSWAEVESKRYVVGPMVELGLPWRFSIEVDALYRRSGFTTSTSSVGGAYSSRYRANTWEFPILLKYGLPVPFARPYVEVGYAARHMSGHYTTNGYTVSIPTGERTPYTTSDDWKPDASHGVVTGAGVEIGSGHWRIAPEMRYTRWNNDPIGIYGSRGYSVNAARNQVELLVGISWR